MTNRYDVTRDCDKNANSDLDYVWTINDTHTSPIPDC